MEEKIKTQQLDHNRYRSSFGATVLFSGVQLYQIIIRIVKSKFVAIFIGPFGMGIQTLLHSTTETISAATNLGLNTSSVKTISAANRDGDRIQISKQITSLRRLIWITGVVGMMICALFAPLWSQNSFGGSEYTWSFIGISVIILLDQLNKGELALLQGLRQKKKLAKANVIGQTLNALITIPLYYFFGVKAIVGAFVIGSFITLILSKHYTRTLDVVKIKMSWRESFQAGMEMVKLGFFLSLQYLMATIVVWVIRNYISNVGSIEEVGLYGAGTAIVTSYIGLVFTAISTDYFPCLSATKDNVEMRETVHIQAELTLLLLTPLVVAFILFCKPIVIFLYSDSFLPIENMMYWSVAAVLFQTMGWAVSYTLLAKASPLYFFLNELFATIWSLPIKLICYKYWGLTGFGVATMLCYGLYLIQVLIVTKKLFNLFYNLKQWMMLIKLYLPIAAILALKLYLSETISYFIGSIVLIAVSLIVLYHLNKMMDLKKCLIKITKQRKK